MTFHARVFLSSVSSNEPHLRCSKNNIPKARMRTLKMSIVIVICFIVCWTPYYLLGLWYWFFPDDLEGKVSHSLTHILFIFGLFNACLDPIIYGLFTIRFRKGRRNCYQKATVMSDQETNSTVITASLKCTVTALPSKRGMTTCEKDNNCGQAEPKSSDSRCMTVFSRGEGRQTFHFNAESTIWYMKTEQKLEVKAVDWWSHLTFVQCHLYTGPVCFTITPNVHALRENDKENRKYSSASCVNVCVVLEAVRLI